MSLTLVKFIQCITYSLQADVFLTREIFSEAVLHASDKNKHVIQLVCCQEEYKDGGPHFHMALKLDRLQQWLTHKHNLKDKQFVNDWNLLPDDIISAPSIPTFKERLMRTPLSGTKSQSTK